LYLYFVFYTRNSYVTCFVSCYIPFKSKEVVELINQTSANSVCECLPRRAKAGTNYAEGKVRLGDFVDSDGSKYSPHSGESDEDEDIDKKQRTAKTKSPSRNLFLMLMTMLMRKSSMRKRLVLLMFCIMFCNRAFLSKH
jgi:hypothetical protein